MSSGCKYFLVGMGMTALVLLILVGLGVAIYFFANPNLVSTPPASRVTEPGPDVTFQEPVPGAHLAVGESLLVFATARDPNRVTRADLWIDDQLAIQQSAPDANGLTPFSLIHSLVATKSGTYSLRVRAYNALGIMGESPSMYVTVFDQATTASQQPPVTSEPPATTQPSSQPDSLPPQPQPQPPAPTHPPLPPTPQVPPIGWLPGIAPSPGAGQVDLIPGQLPSLPGAPTVMIMPGLMRDKSLKDLLNPPNAPLQAPELMSADMKGCMVTLTWKDTSGGKATFDIVREGGGDLRESLPQNLAVGTLTYQDKVPNAGTYSYQVVAYARIGQNNYRAKSNPKQVIVPPAADCIPARSHYKLVYFQPTWFQSGWATDAALRVSIGDITRRIPHDQGQFLARGDWSGVTEEVFPAPLELYRDIPNLGLKIHALGSGNGVPDLGSKRRGFNQNELEQSREWTVDEFKFRLDYRLWVEDIQWTGKGTTDKLPAPTNLHFIDITDRYRTLQWDWSTDPKLVDVLDAFVLYRGYSCPGENRPVPAPQFLPKSDRTYRIGVGDEPSGCVVNYQISAYGLPGESPASNTMTANTPPAIAAAKITFQTLTVTQDTAGEISLFANQHKHTSSELNLRANVPLSLDQVNFRGQNNVLTVNLAQNEALNLNFWMNRCATSSRQFLAPNGDWKKFGSKTDTLKSVDKQGNAICTMAIEIQVLD